jgi:orotidine-5'-phosphate decarboxylase
LKLPSRRRLIVALDYGSLPPASDLADKLSGLVGMFKIGNQLFTAAGPEAVQEIARYASGVFLDLKFHDIPTIVAGAVSSGRNIPGVVFLNVHTLGGPAMMQAAAEALARGGKSKLGQKLLGVTILTSMDEKSMRQVGISGRPGDRVVRLAKLAKECGLDGVVASVQETRAIRKACGKDFLIVTPGVRPAVSEKSGRKDDQSRVATPSEAIRAGADYIVVGRPITAAADPVTATEEILREIDQAQAEVPSAAFDAHAAVR